MFRARPAIAAMIWSYSGRSTSNREPAVQRWPLSVKICASAASTARPGSASAKTTTGDLPPSSSDVRFNVGAPAAMTVCPVVVSPVKATRFDPLVRGKGRTGRLTQPVDDVEDTARQVDLGQNLRQQGRRQR